MENSEASHPGFACPHCQMGTLRPRKVVFAHWFEGQFITLPNFPAWVCDICGARDYDAGALEQLEMSLGPEADLRREAARRARPSQPAAPTAPRPTGRRRV
ncbi:MAG: YgiT-type zinc finger protein [Anaerolineales bacterium]